MFVLPEMTTLLIFVAVCASVSIGAVQVLKLLLDVLLKAKKMEKEPFWRNSALRLLSILVGGAVGYFSLDFPVGLVVGMGSGSLSTFFVAVLKKKIQALADKLISKK